MSPEEQLKFYVLMRDDAKRRLLAAKRAVKKMGDEVRFYERKIDELGYPSRE